MGENNDYTSKPFLITRLTRSKENTFLSGMQLKNERKSSRIGKTGWKETMLPKKSDQDAEN